MFLTQEQWTDFVDAVAEAVAERVTAMSHAEESSADELVDVYGAAKELKCSVPTVERDTKAGLIPSVKIGRPRRYRRSDLRNLGSDRTL